MNSSPSTDDLLEFITVLIEKPAMVAGPPLAAHGMAVTLAAMLISRKTKQPFSAAVTSAMRELKNITGEGATGNHLVPRTFCCEVLDMPVGWNPDKNREWVESVIDRKMDVYKASPENIDTLWDAVENRPRVFSDELDQLRDAGYIDLGDFLRAPGD